ncbi:hypothetical protein KIW84_015567 [Lathyrus oleraceus]|uniref:Amine oxidase domain-containing protein n=1 Tax=Pisum sativum TaxID=3888 RepID=A0A9D5BQX1_PEA|nr:hypothetical protein KIW84_015567 [Pisum sativum]
MHHSKPNSRTANSSLAVGRTKYHRPSVTCTKGNISKPAEKPYNKAISWFHFSSYIRPANNSGKQIISSAQAYRIYKEVGKIFETILQETDNVRQEHSEGMSIHKHFQLFFLKEIQNSGWRAFHTRVTKIDRRFNGVKVTAENGKTFVADAAIIVVPLGVLKANIIKFEPELPEWKEAAFADIGVGVENKIILPFKNVFWPNVEFLGVVADTSYGCSYFLNLHKAADHPVLCLHACRAAGQRH